MVSDPVGTNAYIQTLALKPHPILKVQPYLPEHDQRYFLALPATPATLSPL